ncbi:MED18, partial [Cordylochernes scorpioides]
MEAMTSAVPSTTPVPSARKMPPPMQEYLLQGSVVDPSCEVLLHRLRGLCDNSDVPPETFHDYELVFQIRESFISPYSQGNPNCDLSLLFHHIHKVILIVTYHYYFTIFTSTRGTSHDNHGGPTGTPIVLRARQDLDRRHHWHLRYLGQSEMGDKSRATIVRTSIDVSTTKNLIMFLNEVGFRLDYEYVLKGYMFKKGRMKVTVAKVCKVSVMEPNTTCDLTSFYRVHLAQVCKVR